MRLDLTRLWRSIRRSKASAAAVVLTLSLTLGASAALFAIVDAVLLTPPPFANPGALVTLGETPLEDRSGVARAVPYATFTAWRDRAESMASIEAYDGTNLTLTDLGPAERISAADVTPGLLALLGVNPVRGRAFVAEDIGQPVVIISASFWRAKLASDPSVIGKSIVLGSRAHTIVGVLRGDFSYPFNGCDIWRPLPLSAAQAAREGYRVNAIARLADRVAPASLTRALDDVSRGSSPPARVVATSMAAAIAGNAAPTLRLLAVAAALALVIAFTNLAGLLVVRAIDRQRELAVRRALGAGDAEIAKQLMLDAIALVALGTIGGTVLAWWLTPAAARLALGPFSALAGRHIAISWTIVVLVALVALLLAAACGLVSALGVRRRALVDVMRQGASPSPDQWRLRRGFVVGQIAIAFMLVLAVTLVGVTLRTVLATSPGFDAHGVLTMHVALPRATYPTGDRVVAFYSGLVTALQDRLGPQAVGVVDELPLTGDRGRSVVTLTPGDRGPEAVVRSASPGYFEAMRIPIRAGRSFAAQDNSSVEPRAVISELLREQLFGSGSAVGTRVWLSSRRQWIEIVGVVGQVKHRALDEAPLPTVYLPASQDPSPSCIVVVRSGRPDADVMTIVRGEVARLDGSIPVYGTHAMPDVVATSPGVAARRLLAAAFTAFALLAVALSATGLFGAVAHDVALRRVELAIRMALGASPVTILRSTLGQGVIMVAIGLGVGAVLSLWIVRALSTVVIVSPSNDLASAGLAAFVLLTTGLGAVLPAALRAARTDPQTVLRGE